MTVPRYGAKTLWRPVSSAAATSPDRLWPGQVFKGAAKARRNVSSSGKTRIKEREGPHLIVESELLASQ